MVFLLFSYFKIGEADATAIPNPQEHNNDETISNESNTRTENQTDQSNNNNSDGSTKPEIKQKPRKKLMKSKKVVPFSFHKIINGFDFCFFVHVLF